MSYEVLRWYIPLFLAVYLLVTFVLPSYRVYKQTGIHPVTFGQSDSAHDYIGRMMKAVTAALAAGVLLFALPGGGYRYTVPIGYLQYHWLQVAGLVLMHLSLLWILLAQHTMRHSWRIGIDETHQTKLVTEGVFRFSRNPIFLGMISSLTGLLLLLPNALNLVVLVTSYLLIQVQIRLEEAFLAREHGVVYQRYRAKVRRFI